MFIVLSTGYALLLFNVYGPRKCLVQTASYKERWTVFVDSSLELVAAQHEALAGSCDPKSISKSKVQSLRSTVDLSTAYIFCLEDDQVQAERSSG